MPNKDFKVKNKLQVAGITSAGPIIADASGNLDSTAYIATQYGGTGTSTSPTSGQILYSASGTTYAATTLAGLPGTYAVGNTASRPGSPTVGQIYSNTQTGYIEVYTAQGWSQLGVIPLSATIGTATDVGTNIAYGSGSVDVAFTAASGGGLASSFTAISSPGSISVSGTSSPIRVTGLTQGTAYTFTVTATNGYGNALASSSSNSVTPTSVPQTPTIGSPSNVTGVAYGSTCSVSVPVTANAAGGKSITGFTVTSSPELLTGTSTSSPVIVAGLTSGTAYTFTAVATNANGNSISTSASSSLTPSTVPQAPTIGTITDQGASRPYNNGQASIAFTANATGNSAITGYTVKAYNSAGIYQNLSTSGASSPLVITGLQSSTQYKYTVYATNANGNSAESSFSSLVTATTVPQAPTIGTATVSGTTGSITFIAGATGGSTITSYTATSSPGNLTGTSASSPVSVSGLSSGTTYTFTITATNSNGTSTTSSTSNSITVNYSGISAWTLTTAYPTTAYYPRQGLGGTSNYGWIGLGSNEANTGETNQGYYWVTGSGWTVRNATYSAYQAGIGRISTTENFLVGGYSFSSGSRLANTSRLSGNSFTAGTSITTTGYNYGVAKAGGSIIASGCYGHDATYYTSAYNGTWSSGSTWPLLNSTAAAVDNGDFTYATFFPMSNSTNVYRITSGNGSWTAQASKPFDYTIYIAQLNTAAMPVTLLASKQQNNCWIYDNTNYTATTVPPISGTAMALASTSSDTRVEWVNAGYPPSSLSQHYYATLV